VELPISGEFIAMENTGVSAVRRSRTRRLPRFLVWVWLGWVCLLAVAAAHASDNSKSTLEVFALLAQSGSAPISYTPPPPINIRPKPPSLQVLKQQLAADQQVLADQQAGLTMAQSQLAFWQAQDAENPELSQGDTNVPIWTQAVASDQHLLATVQAQIAQLHAQIAAAQ
jgi:hypothetical protein